jgi:hypothetical protein
MKTFTLKDVDRIGIVTVIKDKVITIDRFGLTLLNQFGTRGKNSWRFNYSIPYLHRVEPLGLNDRDNIKFKVVLFHRELLGLYDREYVGFKGSFYDYRVTNFYVGGIYNSVDIVNNVRNPNIFLTC